MQATLPLASVRLRLVSLVYEGMLLFAVLFVASYLFLSIARDAQSGLSRAVFQIYLLSVCGAYFVFCWSHTGQTLPMKTWRMRIVTEEGRPERGQSIQALPARHSRDPVGYQLALGAIRQGTSISARSARWHSHCESER